MPVAELHREIAGRSEAPARSEAANAGAARPARPRRVLFMDHTAEMGGGEIALLNLATHLDPSRYVPVVVMFSDGPLLRQLRDAGIETLVVPLDAGVVETRKDKIGARSLLQFGRIRSAIGFIRTLRRAIRQIKPDVVHTNSLKSDVLGGLAARWVRVPLVWHLRDRVADDYLPWKVVRVFRFLSRRVPHVIIAVSRGSMQTLLPEGTTVYPENMRVVYDGTPDLEELPASHDAPPPPGYAPRIAIVGRISRWKGQHIFIRAAERVLRRFPNAHFQIVGSAMFGQEPYELEVRQLAKDLKIADKVEFTGFRADVKAMIGRQDLLVHASITGEPFGQVVMEGMAQGKPIVATNGGGMPEVIDHGVTGLLVPMGDDAAMADAIETFLADPATARQFGRKGWERVRDRFTSHIVAQNVQDVYDKLLGAPV
jgi:glycosyltransferase involved in cell wall biosynthesis